MDSVFVDPERWQAWDRFVEARDDGGFMQASWWAHFRESIGFDHFGIVLRSDGRIVGGALVARWPFASGRCFYYIQDGPLLPEGDEAFAQQVFDALLDRIERHRRDDPERVSHLRIEPRWPQRRVAMHGFEAPDFADDYREPRHSLWLDLRGGDDALLARMKPKGRYNVRVAMRHGVSVESDDSPRGFDDFLRLYRRTMKRNALDPKPAAYFRELLARATPAPMLLFAQYQGRRIAAALVVTFGRRATYFYGGSLRLFRRTMVPYMLHAEAARRAGAAGCDWYDLWGVSPPDEPEHPWRAISEFKRKLGGVEIDRGPALDRVYDPQAYADFRASV
jgi:peptidoglycan pentaglycine glycine transferase (the first glycine)